MLLDSLVKIISRCTITHKERLEMDTPCIYIPNHTSLLDAFVLGVHLPDDVVFVANTQITKDYAWAMKGRQVLAVDPLNPYAIRDMLKCLKAGKKLVIFPEGRITVTNNLMKIYPGVAYLSLKTGFPLVPIAINGAETSRMFTYLNGKIQTHWFPKISLHVGQPFTFPEMEGKTMRQKKEMGRHIIYRNMQEVLWESRMPNEVRLIELLQKRVKEAPKMIIAEEMTPKGIERVTMKGLWQKTVGLSLLFSNYLSNIDKRVGVMLPTGLACMSTVFGLLHNGRTPAMLNSSMDKEAFVTCLETGEIFTIITSRLMVQKAKLEKIIEASSVRCNIIYLEDLKEEMDFHFKRNVFFEQMKKARATDVDVLLFTSGSEGTPKGVLLSQYNIYANLQQARLMIDFTSQDKVANALPMFHSFGLILSFLSPLFLVPTVLIQSPLMFKTIPEIAYDRNATILFGTCTFLSAYGRFADPFDFSRLRYVFCGAEKLQESVRMAWLEKFGLRIYEGYGLTETSPILALQTPMLYQKGTVGCLVPAVLSRIEPFEGVEEGGKLVIQAPNLMKGYLLHGKGFQPAPEWFDTGDIVTKDERGFITIQGRSKRFVKIGGEMVSLTVVEEHAKKAIGEGEAVAVRVTDARKGERIELASTSELACRELLLAYWKRHELSPLLLPSRIHFLKEIPQLGSGKADITKLTKQIQALSE